MTREISRQQPYPSSRRPDQLEDLWNHLVKNLPPINSEDELTLKSFLAARIRFAQTHQQTGEQHHTLISNFEQQTPPGFFDRCSPYIKQITDATRLNGRIGKKVRKLTRRR